MLLFVSVHSTDRHESPSAGVRGSSDPIGDGGTAGLLSGNGEEGSGRLNPPACHLCIVRRTLRLS